MEKNLTNRAPLRILAIDPGTREMGYAVLARSEIVRSGVHPFRHGMPPQRILVEGQRFVAKLIKDFEPHLFVIEKTFYANSKHTSLLHVFAGELKKLVTRRRGKRARGDADVLASWE